MKIVKFYDCQKKKYNENNYTGSPRALLFFNNHLEARNIQLKNKN